MRTSTCARVLLTALVSVASACGADTVAERDEDAVALERLEALGFDSKRALIEGDYVGVDDVRFIKSALINGEYDAPLDVDESVGGEGQKGYRRTSLVSAANAGNIKLVFSTGPYAPSAAVVSALTNAASQWSNVSLSTIRIATNKTGPAITVTQSSLSPAGCGSTAAACADFPLNGKPGANLWFRTQYSPGALFCSQWSTELLLNVALHELGHAIGFTHPKAAGSVQISGTMSCGGADEQACAASLNYETVMDGGSNNFDSSCFCTDPQTLTPDDRASVATVY